jgi:hypothetical protein
MIANWEIIGAIEFFFVMVLILFNDIGAFTMRGYQ